MADDAPEEASMDMFDLSKKKKKKKKTDKDKKDKKEKKTKKEKSSSGGGGGGGDDDTYSYQEVGAVCEAKWPNSRPVIHPLPRHSS